MSSEVAFVFDLGKVLLDFDYGRAVEKLHQYSALSKPELKALIDQSPLLFEFETGKLTTTEFFEAVRHKAKYSGDREQFESAFGDIFSPIPPMIELAQRLRARGYLTAIFSNTNDIAIRHIRRKYPFFAGFDHYIFSFEEQAMKPAPSIYEAVERRLGLSPEDLIYIDDRAENIETARHRRWTAIHHLDTQTTHARLSAMGHG